MTGRLSSTAWVGLGLIFTGILWFGGWWVWEATRIWTPLDVPVSLSVGHVRTAEFKVNVESDYAVGIAVDRNSDYELPCRIGVQWCEDNPSVLDAAWSVSKADRVVARGTSEAEHDTFWLGWASVARRFGTFHATAGRYTADVNFLKDGSRLNERTPRLVVIELGSEGENAISRVADAFLVCVLFFTAGAFVIVRSAIVQAREKWAALAKASCLTEPGPQRPVFGATRSSSATVSLRHHRELRPWNAWPFSRTSWYGLIATNIYQMGAIPAFLLYSLGHPFTVGLTIHLAKPGIAAQRTAGIQPLRVRVEAAMRGARPKLYIDSRLVSWEDFGAVLQKELSQRPPNWPVYVEGSLDMEWGHAVRAIDVIRGLQAQVVLLTPSTASGR